MPTVVIGEILLDTRHYAYLVYAVPYHIPIRQWEYRSALIGLMGTEIQHPDMDQWQDRFVSEYTFREKESHDLLEETIVIIFVGLQVFRRINV
jgi:hypothetical protein